MERCPTPSPVSSAVASATARWAVCADGVLLRVLHRAAHLQQEEPELPARLGRVAVHTERSCFAILGVLLLLWRDAIWLSETLSRIGERKSQWTAVQTPDAAWSGRLRVVRVDAWPTPGPPHGHPSRGFCCCCLPIHPRDACCCWAGTPSAKGNKLSLCGPILVSSAGDAGCSESGLTDPECWLIHRSHKGCRMLWIAGRWP